MPRVSIIGCSGAGKSTLSRLLRDRLGLAWLELDALNHQPGWTPQDPEVLRREVVDFMDSHQDWVVDGNYRVVADLVRPRCTDIVWIDRGRWRVLWQVGRRSLGRVLFRTELWNGNRERWQDLLSSDPERSVIRWAMKTHGEHAGRFESLRSDPGLAGVRFHRVTGRASIEALVESLATGREDRDAGLA